MDGYRGGGGYQGGPPRAPAGRYRGEMNGPPGPAGYGDVQQGPPQPIPIVMKNNTGKRLFVGSVPQDINEQKMREMVEEIVPGDNVLLDCYVNSEKKFAFLDFDSRDHASQVKDALDGRSFYGRTLVIRRANHKSSVWVGNVPLSVSNEILYKAFEQFGPVERAIVVCDQHGKSLGWGFVEFVQKRSSTKAVERCTQQMFMLAGNTPPVKVRLFEPRDDEEGAPEHKTNRNPMECEEVATAPHFMNPDHPCYPHWKKYSDLLELQEKEEEDLANKQKAMRIEMFNNMRKEMHMAAQQRQQEQRDRDQKQWQLYNEKQQEAARLQRELDALRPGAPGPANPYAGAPPPGRYGAPPPGPVRTGPPQHGGPDHYGRGGPPPQAAVSPVRRYGGPPAGGPPPAGYYGGRGRAQEPAARPMPGIEYGGEMKRRRMEAPRGGGYPGMRR